MAVTDDGAVIDDGGVTADVAGPLRRGRDRLDEQPTATAKTVTTEISTATHVYR
jgi:hypothetical protein